MNKTIRIAFLLMALAIATVCHAGLDGTTWSDGTMTVTFYTEGGKTMVKTHEWNGTNWNVEARPYRNGGLQWMEAAMSAGSVFAAEPQGNKLSVFVQSADSQGHQSTVQFTLNRVSK